MVRAQRVGRREAVEADRLDAAAGQAPERHRAHGAQPDHQDLGVRGVVPVHYEGWAHFTQGAHELRSAFAAAGMTDRLVLAEPGASVSL